MVLVELILDMFNQPMTKSEMAIKKDSLTSRVTSTEKAPIPSTKGGLNVSALLITGHKLNRQNYLQWSHAVMIFMCNRGKDDCLTGVVPQPMKEDLTFKGWKAKNNMTMS